MMVQIAHITVPLMHKILVFEQFNCTIVHSWSTVPDKLKLNDHIVIYLFGTLGPVDS